MKVVRDDRCHQLVSHPFDGGSQHLSLGAHEVMDRRRLDPGLFGYPRPSRTSNSVVEDHLHGRIEDLVAP